MVNEARKSPLDSLTQAQRERLKRLSGEIQFDKLTVSFSIEDRDVNNRKKSAFYSVTASRGAGAEIPQMHETTQAAGFAPEDVKIVRHLLCKHVVAAVYDDASKRNLMSQRDAVVEAQAILGAHDEAIARLLQTQATHLGDAQ
jgi:hypothetical protein